MFPVMCRALLRTCWCCRFHSAISLFLCRAEKTQTILDEVLKEHESVKGVGAVLSPIDLQAGNVTLKVVPWIGGRIVSMIHKPSGYEWLEGRFETGCYEEYSGSEYRSSGCTEEYQVVRYFPFTKSSLSENVEKVAMSFDIFHHKSHQRHGIFF